MSSRPQSQSRSRQPSPLSRRYRPREDDETILTSDATAFHAGRVAVITGAASGIGLAAAKKFARHGLQICLADVSEAALKEAEDCIASIIGKERTLAVLTDVSSLDSVQALKEAAFTTFGEVNVLLHCAAINKGSDGSIGSAMGNLAAWNDVLGVNLMGTLNVVQTFTTSMCSQENPGAIILTGSKQGITNPPSNAAYNVSKGAVRMLAENLSHELRNRGGHTTAHLFVPGWTWTGMTGANAAASKPDGAWTAAETINYMFSRVRLGDFYIICPDGETSPDDDRLRIKWSAEDVYEGRPALSRWSAEWAPIYAEYIQDNRPFEPET